MSILRDFDDKCDDLIRFVMARSGLAIAVISIISLSFFTLLAIYLPLLSDGEAHFIASLKQMITEDTFKIDHGHLTGLLSYWVNIPILHLLGYDQIFSYRILPVIGAFLFVLASFLIGRRIFGREAGFLAGLFALLPLVTVSSLLSSGIAMPIAGLIVLNYYAQSCLWRRTELNKPNSFVNRHFFIFWVSLALACLLSGVSLFFIIIPLIILSFSRRDISWLAPLQTHYGLPITAFLIVPPILYFISDYTLWDIFLGDDQLLSAFSLENYQTYWPFSYLTGAGFYMWPLIILLPISLWFALKHRDDDRFQFCLLAFIPLWLLLEALPIKHIWLALPIVALIAVVMAGFFVQYVNRERDLSRGVYLVTVSLYCLISLLIAIKLPYSAYYLGAEHDICLYILVSLSILVALFNVICFSEKMMHALVVGLLVQIMLLVPYYGIKTIPEMRFVNYIPAVKQAITKSECSENALIFAGFKDPKLNFHFAGKARFLSISEASAQYLTATPCTLFFVNGALNNDLKASPDDKIMVFNSQNFETTSLNLYQAP
ncbi:MAG: hypothetical protein AAF621_04290 [Pseudomonadota bacterium]